MTETVWKIIVVSVIGLFFWAFFPRTDYYGESGIIYPVEVTYCNANSVCDVARFLTPIKIRIDILQSRVIWTDTKNASFGEWTECSIIDRNNWWCKNPDKRMLNGYLESEEPKLRYLSGYSYRLHWLGSLLPDLRKKS